MHVGESRRRGSTDQRQLLWLSRTARRGQCIGPQGEQAAHGKRRCQHPLADGDIGQDVIDKMRRGPAHPASRARGARASALPRVRDQGSVQFCSALLVRQPHLLGQAGRTAGEGGVDACRGGPLPHPSELQLSQVCVASGEARDGIRGLVVLDEEVPQACSLRLREDRREVDDARPDIGEPSHAIHVLDVT
jgi:hypothetical protein